MYISALFHYSESVNEMTVTQARARLADVVDEARTRHDAVYLTRRGRRIAAVIGIDDLERLTRGQGDCLWWENKSTVDLARHYRAALADHAEDKESGDFVAHSHSLLADESW
jgi:prevent-host-death family protein